MRLEAWGCLGKGWWQLQGAHRTVRQPPAATLSCTEYWGEGPLALQGGKAVFHLGHCGQGDDQRGRESMPISGSALTLPS